MNKEPVEKKWDRLVQLRYLDAFDQANGYLPEDMAELRRWLHSISFEERDAIELGLRESEWLKADHRTN